MIKKITAVLITVCLCLQTAITAFAQTDASKSAEDAQKWLTANIGSASAGTAESDWSVISASLLNGNYKNEAYADALRKYVKTQYNNAMSGKATEWHRIALALRASSATSDMKVELDDGTIIDLINSGVFFNENLGRQGINGFLWGLIAVNETGTEASETAVYSTADIIDEILSKEIDGGGFAMSGTSPDPDVTAFAVRALYPYRNGNNAVKSAVERALTKLSEMQLESGGYSSWGTENCESTAQVLIALAYAGIDVKSDTRFIKNSNTVLSALTAYRNSDGGFAHEKGAESGIIPTYQTLYALAVYCSKTELTPPTGSQTETTTSQKPSEAAADTLKGYGNAFFNIALIFALIFGVLIVNDMVRRRKARKNGENPDNTENTDENDIDSADKKTDEENPDKK